MYYILYTSNRIPHWHDLTIPYHKIITALTLTQTYQNKPKRYVPKTHSVIRISQIPILYKFKVDSILSYPVCRGVKYFLI